MKNDELATELRKVGCLTLPQMKEYFGKLSREIEAVDISIYCKSIKDSVLELAGSHIVTK